MIQTCRTTVEHCGRVSNLVTWLVRPAILRTLIISSDIKWRTSKAYKFVNKMFGFVKQKRAQLITKVLWSQLNPGKKKKQGKNNSLQNTSDPGFRLLYNHIILLLVELFLIGWNSRIIWLCNHCIFHAIFWMVFCYFIFCYFILWLWLYYFILWFFVIFC